MEDIQISNLIMKNIHKSPAIHINTKYWIDSSPEPVNEKTPQFRNIQVSNVTGTNCKRSVEIIGLEEFPVQNISLSQVKISAEQGLICENAERVQMQDIHINSPEVPYQFKDCKKLWLNGMDTDYEAEAPIQLHNVQQAAVNNSLPFHQQQKILISGKSSAGINPDIALRSKESLTYKNGASENSIEKL